MKSIYLDYAASTPVDPRVLRVMQPYFGSRFGNPGSLHAFGQQAIAAVDTSRETIARSIGADFREIIFTASATEANNLALRGVIKRIQNPESTILFQPRIIVSTIEHESVLETARELEEEGIEVIRLPVDRHGVIALKKLKESLTEATVLVSVMHANNEIGTLQPIREIAKIIRDFQGYNTKQASFPTKPYFHVDAAQTFPFLDCDVEGLGIDLMTFSAHKAYGPKGAGALYVKNSGGKQKKKLSNSDYGILSSLITGGGQEFGMRSGTENVPAIVGFARAAELISHSRKLENKKMSDLRVSLWKGIKNIYPKAEINGFAPESTPDKKKSAFQLPNILNVCFPSYAAQDLITRFDLRGLAVSSGSACRSRGIDSSYVIEAMGYSKERIKSSIRFSLGRPTTKQDINVTLKIIRAVLG